MKLGRKLKRETFMGFSRDGDLLVDENATKIEEQLIVDAHGLAFPSRDITPSYLHLEPERPPVLRSGVYLETGAAVDPSADAWFVLQQAPAIWKAAATGFQRRQQLGLMASRKLQWAGLIIGCIWLLGCLLFVGAGMKTETTEGQTEGQHVVVTTETATPGTGPATTSETGPAPAPTGPVQ